MDFFSFKLPLVHCFGIFLLLRPFCSLCLCNMRTQLVLILVCSCALHASLQSKISHTSLFKVIIFLHIISREACEILDYKEACNAKSTLELKRVECADRVEHKGRRGRNISKQWTSGSLKLKTTEWFCCFFMFSVFWCL